MLINKVSMGEVVMQNKLRRIFAEGRRYTWAGIAVVVLGLAAVPLQHAFGQSQTTTQPSSTGQQNPPPQQPQGDSGGPGADNGSIAIPKKNSDDNNNQPPPAPAPPEPKFKQPEGAPNYSLQINVPEVTVDVGVLLEKTHQFVPGLKPANFRVYEDGVEQKVEGFKRVEAPITALLLCEFAARGWVFRMDMLNTAWAFTQQLRPQDYVAMMTYDLNSHIVSDFTQDKRQIQEGIRELGNEVYMPAAFSETDIFDALNESLDRLSRVQGEKYIILIGSGVDTMSKLTLDQILKRVKESHDITIFTISTGGLLMEMTEGTGGMMGGMRDLTYLQAENQMRTFANLTGGMYFDPKFTGELPDMVKSINENIRAKYELIYKPTNAKQDGTWRKLRVVLVDEEGHPLRMEDEKHKPLKYDIIARDGYRARQEVE
jgi:VWFA-related protein